MNLQNSKDFTLVSSRVEGKVIGIEIARRVSQLGEFSGRRSGVLVVIARSTPLRFLGKQSTNIQP